MQDHLVILDYGYPDWTFVGGSWQYGVRILGGDAGYHDIPSVVNSAVEFAHKYYDFANGADPYSHLRLVIGVNSCCTDFPLQRLQEHGSAWAGAVNTIKTLIGAYSSQVDVVGGNDIENWNDPYATTQWLNNYKTASSCLPGENNSIDGCFYNFGTAITNTGTICATSRSSPWQACDVWYLSWGAMKNGYHFARPLPEIYHGYASHLPWGSDAGAWKDLSVFSDAQMHADPMFFVGTLTQRMRCGDTCGWGNNYPWEGFQLLSRALASNVTTRQAMRWSTDIEFQPNQP